MILNSKSTVVLWAQTNMAESGLHIGTAMQNVTDPLACVQTSPFPLLHAEKGRLRNAFPNRVPGDKFNELQLNLMLF